MGIKIGSLAEDIKIEFEKNYRKFGNIEERSDYKFIMSLCKSFPNFEISDGFPHYLLGDFWEIIYDIFANYDVKLAIKNHDETFYNFINFVEEYSKLSEYKRCVECVFDGVYGFIGVTDLYKVFGEETVKIWKEYTKDWKTLKL